MLDEYRKFIDSRSQLSRNHGFEPIRMPDNLKPFQRSLTEWAIRKGRSALFVDTGLGKAQPVDELVLTRSGWVKIGSIKIGDSVISGDGTSTEVVGVYPQGIRPTVRVTFNDGSFVSCDKDHLWCVQTDLGLSRKQEWKIKTISEIVDSGLYAPDGRVRWRIPVVGQVEHDAVAEPIDPYVIGCLLGDGCFRSPNTLTISNPDGEIIDEIRRRIGSDVKIVSVPVNLGNPCPTYRIARIEMGGSGGRTNPVMDSLKRMGLWGLKSQDKFIPGDYLFGSISQRTDLLRGLMDTDGYVSESGTVQFNSSSKRLFDGVVSLVRSLGGVARVSSKIPTYTYKGEKKEGLRHWTATIAMPETVNPFFLPRKADRFQRTKYLPQRKIVSVVEEGPTECVCIAVDHPSHTYVTRDHIVTHNTFMQLVWADNVIRHTNKPVLILCPLGVVAQTVHEAERWGIEAERSRDGLFRGKRVVVTNYDRLDRFNPDDFAGVVADESSVLKNEEGVRTAEVTEFMRMRPYRLLCTATASPNDHIELGTSSECLGELGHMDMLLKFFKGDNGSLHPFRTFRGGVAKSTAKWQFRPHAEEHFWRWVCSWARACRKPSDLGFDDTEYVLPPHEISVHTVHSSKIKPGYLFEVPARGLAEQRSEQKRTTEDRCGKAADLLNHDRSGLAWCHTNNEGDILTRMISGAVQISGKDKDERKEEVFEAFVSGQIRVLVTKPKIAGMGLNFQHCAHQTYFPSNSFEQYYQCLRRLYRFGQKSTVQTDLITTEGGAEIMANLDRKRVQAEVQYTRLVELMNASVRIDRESYGTVPVEMPAWL